MVALTLANCNSYEATTMPRFAAPPGLAAPACSKFGEVDTPETQSPRSSLADQDSTRSAQTPEQSPRSAGTQSADSCQLRASPKKPAPAKGKKSAACTLSIPPPPGLQSDREIVEGPSLVEVFAEFREQQMDPYCILKLRKVQHLGARPMEALERHYSKMPGFLRVVVVYSHMKIPVKGEMINRCKPSGMAFVIFSSPKAANTALAKGAEQKVAGFTIAVGRYQPEDSAPKDANIEKKVQKIVEGAIFAL